MLRQKILKRVIGACLVSGATNNFSVLLQFQADIPRFTKSFRKTVMPEEDLSCITQWERAMALLLRSSAVSERGDWAGGRAEHW